MTIDSDKRSGIDRRKRAGFNLQMLAGYGKRRIIRRQEDRGRIFFVDQYRSILFVTIVAILFLCVIDAILTIILLNRGAYETNPIMAYLLDIGPYAFFIPKYAITIISTFGLFLFRDIVIRRLNLSTQSILYLIVWIYAGVVAWEFYLIYYVI